NDLLRSAVAILPAACLWGASFPLALAAIASRPADPGRLVGEIYGANTAGAILGSLGFSLVLIPAAGTQHSERILIGLSAVAALAALGSAVALSTSRILLGAAAVAFLAWTVPPVPW